MTVAVRACTEDGAGLEKKKRLVNALSAQE